MSMTENRLRLVEIDVTLIDPNPWNPNRQSEAVARAERESIQRFGFIDPVTVRPHPEKEGRYQIIDGEHRWREACSLGETTVPCVILNIGDVEARKLTIVLNETRGEADVVLLGALLADLQAQLEGDEFALALPYSASEIEHLTSLSSADWDQFDPAPVPAPDPNDPGLVLVSLEFGANTHDLFQGHFRILAKEYGVEDLSEVVARAMSEQAILRNQG